jgi:hypothetical protein
VSILALLGVGRLIMIAPSDASSWAWA